MLTESAIVKFFDINPLSFPKLSRSPRSCKIISLVFYSAACISTVLILNEEDENIVTVVRNIVEVTNVVGSLAALHFIIFPPEMVFLDDLAQFETNSSKGFDFFILPLGLYTLNVITDVRFLRYGKCLFNSMVVLQNCAMYQLLFLKIGISRRVRFELERAVERQDILGSLSRVSQLLDTNRRVNRLYSFQGAFAVVGGLQLFWWSLTAYWVVYGLHKRTGSVEDVSPIINIFYQGHVVFILIFVGFSTTQLSGEVCASWLWN